MTRQCVTRNTRHIHLPKTQGHNLTSCQNNTVIETKRYARHKIAKLQLSSWTIWSRWSDVSVPEVKSFLGLIINMVLIPLPTTTTITTSLVRGKQITFFW
jgi:hypothetical protein